MKPLALTLTAAFASVWILGSGTAFAAPPARVPPALSAFGRAIAAITAYNTTITVFEQRGAAVQTVILKYTFRKPSTVTTDEIGGPNNGVSLLWTGGTTVSAHRSGLAGAFKETFSLHDPKVTTIRGSSIDELSFDQIFAHAQQTPGRLSQGPGPTINEVATDAVTLIPTHPATDAGYTREVIEISRVTHFPLRIMGYQGSTLVRKVDFVAVELTH
jgi:hypothetical protein